MAEPNPSGRSVPQPAAPAGQAAPAAPAAGPAPSEPANPPAEPLQIKRTRTSSTYVGLGVGLVVAILVLIFIIQNLHNAHIDYLGASFDMPVGLLVLAATIAGGVIVLLVSLARVVQLRMAARRHRAAHDRR